MRQLKKNCTDARDAFLLNKEIAIGERHSTSNLLNIRVDLDPISKFRRACIINGQAGCYDG